MGIIEDLILRGYAFGVICSLRECIYCLWRGQEDFMSVSLFFLGLGAFRVDNLLYIRTAKLSIDSLRWLKRNT